MKKTAYFIVVLLMLGACTSQPELKTGMWRGVLTLQEKALPFTFEVAEKEEKPVVYIQNGDQRLLLDEIEYFGDSVQLVLHIFDAQIRARLGHGEMEGTFIKNYNRKLDLPFHATYGNNYRYAEPSDEVSTDYSGKYQLTIVSENNKETITVGTFSQEGNRVTGSILTPTGDYGFLDGNVVDGKLWLSNFDGNHAFIIEAGLDDDILTGDLYTGTRHRIIQGRKDDRAALPGDEFTWLKEGYSTIEATFPDLNNAPVSLGGEQFKDKVVVLQLFGTWCPNCMDETNFLAPWYKENRDRGVEIVGLAFERKDDFAYASERVAKMKDKLNVTYPLLIAGSIKHASDALPMLNKVAVFPTTIYIGKDGTVRYIHAGFEGPGTGEYYERFVADFDRQIDNLLAE